MRDALAVLGLSPRLRGNPRQRRRPSRPRGTIPAPAGKPSYRRTTATRTRDYPRACGETAIVPTNENTPTGLSPRLRGNRHVLVVGNIVDGTIPAPAGKPACPGTTARRPRDYPRACGETPSKRAAKPGEKGLSPRLRGNPGDDWRSDRSAGTIPAPAGKPSRSGSRKRPCRDYPRACGETSPSCTLWFTVWGLSPRLRGNRPRQISPQGNHGTIPAPAGKPVGIRYATPPSWDYPRACGETPNVRLYSNLRTGLSPRLRGNQETLCEVIS